MQKAVLVERVLFGIGVSLLVMSVLQYRAATLAIREGNTGVPFTLPGSRLAHLRPYKVCPCACMGGPCDAVDIMRPIIVIVGDVLIDACVLIHTTDPVHGVRFAHPLMTHLLCSVLLVRTTKHQAKQRRTRD